MSLLGMLAAFVIGDGRVRVRVPGRPDEALTLDQYLARLDAGDLDHAIPILEPNSLTHKPN